MKNRTLFLIGVLLILVSISFLMFHAHTTFGHVIRVDPFGDSTGCGKYLLVDGKTFCFRGNNEFSAIPAIMSASTQTGVEVIFGKATMGNTGHVAVYVEDAGDLGFFWDAAGLFK